MTLTIEELKYGAEVGDLGIDAVRSVCAEELANREARPVAYTEQCEISNMQATGLYLRGFPDNSQGRNIPLYTAPPAPAVPPGYRLQPISEYDAMCEYVRDAAPAPAVNASPDFETWFVEKYKQPERLMKNGDGAYKFSGVQMAFSAWIDGRAAMLAQPVSSGYKLPDGFKLMPLEMTDEIGEAIAMEARCCGGIALCIYEAALAASPESGNDHDTGR